MPLPLPNLDTERWADLVERGRALVPGAAPGWTDLNLHDPGVTQIELLAWLVEQDVFRVNRIPRAHRLKFLALLGYAPRPPEPALVPLTFTLNPGEASLPLPAGLGLESATGERATTLSALTAVDTAIASVIAFDGSAYADLTGGWRAGTALPAFGSDPTAGEASGPALYLGFEPAPGQGVPLTLWVEVGGASAAAATRARLAEEAAARAALCRARAPVASCDPEVAEPAAAEEEPASPPAHHDMRIVWELHDGTDWIALDPDAGEVADDTRALTLDGAVTVTPPFAPAAVTVHGLEHAFLRCRLAGGRPDAPVALAGVRPNTVLAEQAVPPAGSEYDAEGRPLPRRIGPLERVPRQTASLPGAPVSRGELELWSEADGASRAWRIRRDLDASGPHDADVALDPDSGTVAFGDGLNGRLVPHGAMLAARYRVTLGADGNVAPTTWRLDRAAQAGNEALLAGGVAAAEAALAEIDNATAGVAGRDQETPEAAAARAADELWAHERLLELAEGAGVDSLDDLRRDRVLARRAPRRATTTLDYERLALDVPGTVVRRARAVSGFDPAEPCVPAPGTVTVVVVPALPAGRPAPTAGLLEAVRSHLDRRRLVGTRLIVTGPDYVEVGVRARLRVRPGADPARVEADALECLRLLFDPLTGGPSGTGWPFGRDVYRSEVLQALDGVPGVDFVEELDLIGPSGASCGNVCVPPTALVTSSAHSLEASP